MPGSPLRLVFAGTPDFAAEHLKALIDSKHKLIAVYTQPDRPAGRGRALQASPVKHLAETAQIPLYQPGTLKDAGEQERLAGLRADLLVVVAYGLILPQAVLDVPTHGCLNVHASLLPRWRGAAPVQRAIEAGDAATGITIMQMDAGLDTGDMLASASCAVDGHTSGSLHAELARLGPRLLLEVLENISDYQARAQPQDNASATYAHKIGKQEGLLDWQRPAHELARRVRAFNPFPGCHTFLGDTRIKLWEATAVENTTGEREPGTIVKSAPDGISVACAEGLLSVSCLQLPGGKRLNARELLHARGARFAPGTRLGTVLPAESR